jgi:transketolase
MIEDIALMRVLPNMRVLVPADYHSAKAALRIAATMPGPFYVRMGRADVAQVYPDTSGFAPGRARVLRRGSEVTIVACGIEVSFALEAAKRLAAEGIEAEVIDAFSIKPLDEATILDSARRTGFVLTAEEHSVIGGLGAAVAELFAEHPTILKRPLRHIGVQDRFGTSGGFEELFREYGLDTQAICDVVIQ